MMPCSLCPNAALRQVAGKGYCKNHRKEADAAAEDDKLRAMSGYGLAGWNRMRGKMDSFVGNNKRGFSTRKVLP